MENSQSQSEPEQEMSYEQKISQDINTAGRSGSRHEIFGQDGRGSAFPHHRLVILSLGLLNAALLITAVVIGIYCARDGDLDVPNSAATPYIIEMNYLRNSSDIVRATQVAQAALEQERINHAQLKLQLQQQVALSDTLQRQIETLHTEKANLLTNKTSLEESCGRCLPGWLFLQSSCYYFSSRHVSNQKKNWLDSRADCVNRGGDLLVINNLEEQELMSYNFPELNSNVGLWWSKGFWMGLTDVETPGAWVWVNNGTEVETMYWISGQPLTTGIQSGHCAALYYTINTKKTWFNMNCQDHLLNWICEKSP